MSDEFVTYYTQGLIEDITGVIPIKFRSVRPVLTSPVDLVPAIAGKKIRVLTVIATTEDDLNTFNFNQATGDISADYIVTITSPLVLEFNPAGWCETDIGLALRINDGAGVNVSVSYIEVTPT